MRNSIAIILLLAAFNAHADIIALKDGTRLEGTVEGEMDGMKLVKTKYGALNINKNDIVSVSPTAPEISSSAQLTAPAASTGTVPAPAAAVAASTSPLELPAAPKPEPKYTFKTVLLSTTSLAFEKVYFENDTVIATETFNAKGELQGLEGFIKDGAYREYYENGNLKTEKPVANAKTSGALKSYYPNGVLQSEAVYAGGRLNGSVRFYNENSRLMFEQNFKDGLQNGFSREFDETGAMKSEVFYVDGHVAELPKAAEAKKPEAAAAAVEAPESMVTAKVQKLARGERYTFLLNNKFAARLTLDKGFNILPVSREGKVSDGAVKVYTKDGKLEREFVFVKNEVTLLKVYGEGGALEGEYTFNIKGEAIKK